jgi:hypothetical protein
MVAAGGTGTMLVFPEHARWHETLLPLEYARERVRG